MKLVFDLDGTIAPYKEDVPKDIAKFLNTLGPIYIVTGGKTSYAKKACRSLTNATIIGMADHHDSIDLAKAMNVNKQTFNNIRRYQLIRVALTEQLNESLTGTGLIALTGGRSTIDIMDVNNTKAQAVDGDDIIYFYDCKWKFNIEHSNDWPMIQKAKKAVRTDYTRIIRDVKRCIQ
jgi:hydroxymethylpyrimidine pyrophosphatase-like HAD family hydrolase